MRKTRVSPCWAALWRCMCFSAHSSFENSNLPSRNECCGITGKYTATLRRSFSMAPPTWTSLDLCCTLMAISLLLSEFLASTKDGIFWEVCTSWWPLWPRSVRIQSYVLRWPRKIRVESQKLWEKWVQKVLCVACDVVENHLPQCVFKWSEKYRCWKKKYNEVV